MAHAPSAKRHMRADAKKRLVNKMRKSAVATYEKKFNALIEAGKLEEAASTLVTVISAYDKAAKKGVLPQNKADRKKSRLTLALKRAQQA